MSRGNDLGGGATPAALIELRGWRTRPRAATGLDDCSLVIATYNRDRAVLRLLDTLTTLPDPPGEVVIVDGSPNPFGSEVTAAWAAGRALPFELVYVSGPTGLTRQRNAGIDATTRELVFFLDDDCLPQSGYFREIREVFRGDASGVIGVVCGSIVNEMDRPVLLRWRIRFAIGLVPRGECGRYYPMGTSVPRALVKPFTGVRPVDIVPGGAAAYRRAALERQRFSLFFEGYSASEDVEMSLRVGRDWDLCWCGDAHVVHDHAASGRPMAFGRGRADVVNRFFIWRRHARGVSLLDRARFWLDVGFLFACDLGAFVRRPRQVVPLAHAAGVVCGALECWVRPPEYREPPARREYVLRVMELGPAAAGHPPAGPMAAGSRSRR